MSSSEMTIEPLYVVDTHALIWYLVNDPKLAVAVFKASENGVVVEILS